MKTHFFWNRARAAKPLSAEQLAIEIKLLPRLRGMSFLFFFLSLCSLLFVLMVPYISPSEEPFNTHNVDLTTAVLSDDLEDEIELGATEVLNFYLISTLFAAVGMGCLYAAKHKKKTLDHLSLEILSSNK